jgi:hypothetical protein
MGDYINMINEQNLKKEKYADKKATNEYVQYLKNRDDAKSLQEARLSQHSGSQKT